MIENGDAVRDPLRTMGTHISRVADGIYRREDAVDNSD